MYTSQPPYFEIDRGNPLTKNITHLLPLGNCDRELVTGSRLTYGAGASKPVTQRGVALKGRAQTVIDFSPYSKLSVSFWFRLDTGAAGSTLMETGAHYSANNGFVINYDVFGTGLFVGMGGAVYHVGYIAKPARDTWHHLMVTLNRDQIGTVSGLTISLNGVSMAVIVAAYHDVTGNFSLNTLFLNSRTGGTLFSDFHLQNIVIRGGYLATAQEAQEEYLKPWSLFKQPSRRLFIPASLPWFLVAPLYEKVVNNPPQGILLYNSLFMPTHEKVLDALPQYVLPYNDLLAPTHNKVLDNLPQYVELAITLTNNTFTALNEYLTQYLYPEVFYHPSVERTFNVTLESRVFSMSAESRSLTIPQESRLYNVPVK